MKTKLGVTRILTVFSIILILALPVISIISIKPVFAANVTLPFSDGFESGDFSKWSYTPGGSVTSGSAYNGTYKAVFNSSYIQAQFTATPVDQCYMRAYVRLDNVSTGAGTSIFGVYKISGYYMAEAGITNASGTLKWTLRYYDNGATHTVVSELYKPVLGKWYCVEVEGKSNSDTNAEARTYIDGNELTDVTKAGLNNTQQINCGYIWISSSNSATVWYDDVAVDTAYIGPEETGQIYSFSVSTVGSGSVDTDKSPPYYYGDSVQLTAVPAGGWSFSSWSGDLSGSTNPTTVLIDGNKTVTATFTQNTYSLAVSTVGSGSVALNNSGPYQYGDIVQLTAVPATQWLFQGWSGDLSGNTNPTTILIDGSKTVTATFYTTRIFADGFETGDFSKWNPVVGSPSVTSEDAHHGTYKAVLNTAGQYAQYRFTSAPVDNCFMKAYVMFKSFPTVETTILGVYNLGGTYMAEARVISVSGTMKWELRYYDNGVSLKTVSELQKPILDTWYCVEVEGKSNTTTDAEARIYINGNELTDVSQAGKNNTLPLNCAYMWINSAGTTIWYDCVVVDRAYIGPEPHDIAVTNVTSSKKIICQGFSGNVTTTIANNGDYSENVNVTIAVVNSTGAQFTIGSFMNVPVNNGTSTDLTITWNTTGFAKDSYTISAYAEPVQGETNTADNTLTDGIVKITIVGDLNGDGKVNLVDVFKVALAYGSVQGDSRWDPNLDINNDGKINLIDYFITALNFGKSDP